ncbi:hypothetical protein NCCP2145_01720 [Pseudarthrobacter sp. NCCP-2145]|nr:hypothetical protein NCCP2145_01720 [Pseudarthrobacter sp. NCCP-2145]
MTFFAGDWKAAGAGLVAVNTAYATTATATTAPRTIHTIPRIFPEGPSDMSAAGTYLISGSLPGRERDETAG